MAKDCLSPRYQKSIKEFGDALDGDFARPLGLSHTGQPFYRQTVGNHSILFISKDKKKYVKLERST